MGGGRQRDREESGKIVEELFFFFLFLFSFSFFFFFWNTINIINKFLKDLVLYLSCICLGVRV